MLDLKDLQKFIKLKSVSTDPKYSGEVDSTAEWLVGKLQELGLEGRVIEGEGAPVVYAQSEQNVKKPTLLVYGHYDVQPAESTEEWSVDPFAGVIESGSIWGRGTSDNKGQFWCHVLAIKDYLSEGIEIPVNLKFLIEGEEEIGSPNLEKFIIQNKELLECDVAWITDGSVATTGAPTVEAGLRGCVNCEIIVKGPKNELHSGSYGGAIINPSNTVLQIVSSMLKNDGSVAVKGFYEGVSEPSGEVRKVLESEGFKRQEFLAKTGSSRLYGEVGFSTSERVGLRPTIQVTGISSGYQGEGFKNIIPPVSRVKLNIRLVKGQDWKDIASKVQAYVSSQIPKGVEYDIEFDGGNNAYQMDPDSAVIIQAKKAISAAFGNNAVVRYEGGSLPVANYLAENVSKNVLLTGWAEDMHIVDEKLSLELIEKGVEAIKILWDEIGQ